MTKFLSLFIGLTPTFFLVAQGAGHTNPAALAAEQKRQAQEAYEAQVTEINNRANELRGPLLSRSSQLPREMSACAINKSEADIAAEQEANQAKQQATNQMMQGAMQGLTPLFQSGIGGMGDAKKKADEEQKVAIETQRAAATKFSGECSPIGSVILNNAGTNFSTVKGNISKTIFSSDKPAEGCERKAQLLLALTEDANEKIKETEKVKSTASQGTMGLVAAAAALGVSIMGANATKKNAAQGLENANRQNKYAFDACTSAVQDEAAEINRQLASINAQVASDLARLNRQFANFQVVIPPNIQDQLFLGDDTGDDPIAISNMGGSVGPTTFAGPSNPFGNLGKGGGGGEGSGVGAAGGGIGGGDGGGGEVPWGFPDPYAVSSPGMAFTLPPQPPAANWVSGSDGPGGGGLGANPFGDGFAGFEDPFANTGNGNAALALAASSGNGFWELAVRTRRRIYAHLPELLGANKTQNIQASSDSKDEGPERKISSIKN